MARDRVLLRKLKFDSHGDFDRSDQNKKIVQIAHLDMSTAVSGTDYWSRQTITTTFRGQSVHITRFDMSWAGYGRVHCNDFADATELNQFQWEVKLNTDTNRYEFAGFSQHYHPLTIGVKPDDWETAWQWKYYTKYDTDFYWADSNHVPVSYPRGVENSTNDATPYTAWDSGTQYYAADDGWEINQIWVTDRMLTFGGWQAFETYGTGNNPAYMCGFVNGYRSIGVRLYTDGSNQSNWGYKGGRVGFAQLSTDTSRITNFCDSMNPNTPSGGHVNTYRSRVPFVENVARTQLINDGKWSVLTFCRLVAFTLGGVNYIGYLMGYSNPNHLDEPYVPIIYAIEDLEDETLSPWGVEPPAQPPYHNGPSPGDPSGSGGYGPGIPDGDGVLNDGAKPGIFPVGAGLHIYNITNSQFASLSQYLWGRQSSVFDPGGFWDRWKNYKFNPIAGVLSLHHIPLEFLPTGSTAPLAIAGTDFPEIQPMVIGDQWQKYTFDAVDIPEAIQYFADYCGVSASIYLPFCGTTNIPVSAFVGGSLQVEYWCDVVSGNCCASVIATDRGGIQQVIANCTGNCAYVLPVTGNDNGMSKIVGTLENAALSALSANPMGVAAAGIQLALGTEQHHTAVSGSMSGNSGYAAPQKIILTIEYPVNIQAPDEYNSIIGRPSAAGGVVGDYAGYTEFVIDGAEIIEATTIEQDEIANALRSGVFV